MKLGKILYVTERNAWRSWLAKNCDKEKEIWMVYYKKSSGKSRIPYNDAVEEALCYGWIDSIVKKIDEERFAQRFTPRRPSSKLSEMNKERIRKLIVQKKMTPAGLNAIKKVFDMEKDDSNKFFIPDDIIKSLKKDKLVWKNFQKFPESYKRIRIGYLESQRRHSEEAFQKSIRYLIKMAARNKRFGFVRE
jgi:uncharacterized protein YdeI (YjbR/CyaY-like superfamily)